MTAGSAEDALAKLLDCGARPDVFNTDYRLRRSQNGIDALANGYRVLHKPVSTEKLCALLTQLRTNGAVEPAT